MKNFKDFIIFCFLLLFVILIFKYNTIVNDSVISAVYLWFYKVFPSLFIMFILNEIIIKTNILYNISIIINPLFNKMFNTSNNSFEAFLLSVFSGTPSSAFILKEMINNNKIDIDSANKLISFTYFSNPLFLYNILSITFNKCITIKIIIIHYLSNIIIGLILRKNNNYKNYDIKYINHNISIIKIIPTAIKNSINTLLMILGTIVFYMILTNILLKILNLNIILSIILKGFFEITQSLNILNILNTSSIIKEIIVISIISFGGLSIHTQVLSLIDNTNIYYKNFLIGRILHVLISTFTYLMCSIC